MGWSIHHPVGLIYNSRAHCYRGYTLFSTVRGCDAFLIDLEGRICHRWRCQEGIEYAVLLPNGNLLLRTGAPTEADGAERIGGSSGAVLELDWDGKVVWAYRNPFIHHDFERLPNGNTLVLLWERLSPKLTASIRGGKASDSDPEGMFGDLVNEIAPDGSVVFRWQSWDYLSLEEDVICPLENRAEWTHGNSLKAAPNGDLIVSFRRTSTVGIVDKSSGRFRWKWGPGEIEHQHHPTWLDNGRLLLFDNGFHRERSSYSRIVEVDPRTNEIAWEFQGEPPISFYSPNISSAERLPNGNTLICEGAPGRIFEVTPNKEIIWEYINPFFVVGASAAGGSPSGRANSVFRAHRYGPDYPGLQGKDLDPGRYGNLNRLYCGTP